MYTNRMDSCTMHTNMIICKISHPFQYLHGNKQKWKSSKSIPTLRACHHSQCLDLICPGMMEVSMQHVNNKSIFCGIKGLNSEWTTANCEIFKNIYIHIDSQTTILHNLMKFKFKQTGIHGSGKVVFAVILFTYLPKSPI